MPEPAPAVFTLDDSAAAPAVRSAACAHCGAPVEAFEQYCPACGKEQPAAAELVEAEAAAVEQRHFRCENCGAEVAIDPDQRSYHCAFCDSAYVVDLGAGPSGRQPPEFAIPFAVTPEQAQAAFRRWLNDNAWFRPADLKQAHVAEKLRGVYLPFWSFSMLAESGWQGEVGEYWWRTETYTTRRNGKTVTRTRRVRETEWWRLAGRHHGYYSGYLVSGSRGLPQAAAQRIKPFHLQALKRYRPRYLAGWLSEEYTVEPADALRLCRQEFHRREQQAVAAHMPGDTHRRLHVATEFRQVNSDLILLPVYLLSYRYRNKVYRFLLNGQTGKLAGDKPMSAARIAVAVGLAVAVVAAVVGGFMLLAAFG